jgi:hypothetical protein
VTFALERWLYADWVLVDTFDSKNEARAHALSRCLHYCRVRAVPGDLHRALEALGR